MKREGAVFGRLRRAVARALPLCLVLALLAPQLQGCAKRAARPAETPAERQVDRSLNEAAHSIMADLARLNGSTQTYGATSAPIAGPLATRVTLTHDGPLRSALERVCAATGMRLVVEGREREVPVLVRLNARDVPALHVFREIGLQTGPYERVRVDEANRLVTLRWLDPAAKDGETKEKSAVRGKKSGKSGKSGKAGGARKDGGGRG